MSIFHLLQSIILYPSRQIISKINPKQEFYLKPPSRMPALHHPIPLTKEICSAIPEEFVSMAKTLKQNLVNAKHALLTTHIGADGDGLAAMLILKNIITQMNPHTEVQMLLSDRVKNDKYTFLPNYKDIEAFDSNIIKDKYDVALSTDVPNLSQIESPAIKNAIKDATLSVQIDEHARGSSSFYPSKDSHFYINDTSSFSSGEIVLKLCREWESDQPLLRKNDLDLAYFSLIHDNQWLLVTPQQSNNLTSSPPLQLRNSLRQVMNGSFQAIENNLKHIMSSLGHKENMIFQQIVKDLNTHYHIFGNSFNIAIFSISQEDFQTLNQEQKNKLGEDFNKKQDQIIWEEATGLMPKLAAYNPNADLLFLIIEKDKKTAEGIEFKVCLRSNDHKALSELDLTKIAQIIPTSEEYQKKAGGHSRASGANIIAEDLETAL
ncbi:MAG: hypothetical protein EBR67_02460 [Proteobacteria bacterium]|nr:hypothetical protein [Pseudomonadota bacterium]